MGEMSNVFKLLLVIAFLSVAFSFNGARFSISGRRAFQQLSSAFDRPGEGLSKSSLYAGKEETPIELFQEELAEFASGVKNMKWGAPDDEPVEAPVKKAATAPKIEEKSAKLMTEDKVDIAAEPVKAAEPIVAKNEKTIAAQPLKPVEEDISEARVAPAPRKPAPAAKSASVAKEPVVTIPPPVFESTIPGVRKASDDAKTIQFIRDIPIEPAKASPYEVKEEEKTAVMKATQAVTKSFLSSSPFNEKMLSDIQDEPAAAKLAKDEATDAEDVTKAQQAIKNLFSKSSDAEVSTPAATPVKVVAPVAEEKKGGFFDFLKSDPNIMISQQPKEAPAKAPTPVAKVEVQQVPVKAEAKKEGGFFDFLKSDPNLVPTPSAPPTVGQIFLEQQKKTEKVPSIEPVRSPEYYAAKKEAAEKPAFVAKKIEQKTPVTAPTKSFAAADEKKKGGFFDFLTPIDNEPVPVNKAEAKAASAPAPVKNAPVKEEGGGLFGFLKSGPAAPKRDVDVSAFLTKTPAPKEYVKDPSISFRSAPAQLRPTAQVKVTVPPPQVSRPAFTQTMSVGPKVGRSVIYNNIPEKEEPKSRPSKPEAVAKPAARSFFSSAPAKPAPVVAKPEAVAKPAARSFFSSAPAKPAPVVTKPAPAASKPAVAKPFSTAAPAKKGELPKKPSSIYKSLN